MKQTKDINNLQLVGFKSSLHLITQPINQFPNYSITQSTNQQNTQLPSYPVTQLTSYPITK